ncbi:MAG TPA: hypothetical protein VEP66_16250 [Myxococcales bacterium]|nr:hypothetical protein [Myxococcales bacterium]
MGGDALRELIELAARVVERRAEWMRAVRLAPGMLDSLVAAELLRPAARTGLLAHYGSSMPAMRARQLEGKGEPERKVFGEPLRLDLMPRLSAALDALFASVADAGLSCGTCLGAATPRELVEGRTLSEVYARCHFGGSMPMLYAYPADLDGAAGREPLAFVDARLVGPLIHELSHFHTERPPAPPNVHEALAAWIGNEAWPAQVWPDGSGDSIAGAAYFAALGGFIARRLGEREALHVQAGELDLRDALGPACAEALRVYGFLPFLESGAPHFLSDAFHPGRWWKLIDLHRDRARARELYESLVAPVIAGGAATQKDWDRALDALRWRDLPAWNDPPCAVDHRLAALAERALRVRTVRRGQTFVPERTEPPGPLRLDPEACELRAPWPGADVLGAPPVFPWPPALCAQSGAG